VRLPDGTGIELCQRLRKLQPNVPIVITPPTQTTLNMPRCLVAPVSAAELEQTIVGLLNRKEQD